MRSMVDCKSSRDGTRWQLRIEASAKRHVRVPASI